MVSAVSALRTFLTLGVGLIAGGVVGAYAMTVVYGDRSAALDPSRMQCPPCPAIAAAPSPTPCPIRPDDATGPSASASPETVTAEAPEALEVPTEPRLPGLPASALRLASAGMAREIEPCVTAARAANHTGTILLDLTVTSTGSVGHIPAVEVVRADPEVADLGPCLTQAARRVHFEWRDEDGQSRLRFPIAITAPSP